jgi:[protein-PII] uridylyltransferase
MLEKKIEELLYANAAEIDFSKNIKDFLKSYYLELPKIFAKTQGKEFLVKHTKKIDEILKLIYKIVQRKLFGIYAPMQSSIPVVVIALGSYAREQLAPYSDIDLLILYENIKGYNINLFIEKLLYIVWDSKIKLSHRAHEINEIFLEAHNDLSIKTALLESRYIHGSKYLWTKYENILKKIINHNKKEFIEAKLLEAQHRRKKFQITMTPNIKERGLRDSNLLYWIAKINYPISNLKQLTGILFEDEEYKEYRHSLEWLFKIRAALHLANGKKQDTLQLEDIIDLANLIFLKSTKKTQMEIVKKTIESLYKIEYFCDINIYKLTKKYFFYASNIKRLRSSRISKGFFQCNNTIFSSLKTPSAISMLPKKILSANSFHITFLEKLKKSNFNINHKELFSLPHISPFLWALKKTNKLKQYFPQLSKIINYPQFDGYHHFPVDIHLIKSIEALENITDKFVQEIYNSLCKEEKEILKIALLFHDSGKGRKQEHAEVGAKLFKIYCIKHKYPLNLIEKGVLIIKYHTLMSKVALQEDLLSEKTIFTFCAKVMSFDILKMLYVLTYADIKGVGKIYTSFNARLLKELFLKAKEALKKKELLSETEKRIKKENSLKRSKEFLSLEFSLQKKLLLIESNLFFLKYKPFEIIQIALKTLNIKDYSFFIKNDEFLSIEIFRKKPLNLGYLLWKLQYFDVASMDVFKLFDNIKYFKIEFQEKAQEHQIKLIQSILEESFDMNKKAFAKKAVLKKTEIFIDCGHSKTYAKLQLNAKNQIGLLAFVSKIFDEFNIDIASAKINTIKNRAKDLFLIEKNGNFCNNKEKIIKLLTGEG